ncbi:transmembrane signal receptor [Lithospermum erythrorhizon]|uniref:Transmembrane signal receptor n=1 Tax=Lithospermum erythrorhizon TaxID=34254 RepID=A0AAV3PSB6_LITER
MESILIDFQQNHDWPLYQLDVKNTFLNGDLDETIYMEQSKGFVAQEESRMIFLIVYVDDIVITCDDVFGIQRLKEFLHSKFQTKHFGSLKYLLRIEVVRSNRGICINQRKYIDLLEDTRMSSCKPVDSPMDPNFKHDIESGELLEDPGQYRRLVGKLNYLCVTRPDISFATSVVSQFLNSPRTTHMEALVRILRHLKRAPGSDLLYRNYGHTEIQGYTDVDWAGSFDRRSTSGYCVFV